MTAATALMTSFLVSPLTQGAITYPMRHLEAGSGTAVLQLSDSYSHPQSSPSSSASSSTGSRSKSSHPPFPSVLLLLLPILSQLPSY